METAEPPIDVPAKRSILGVVINACVSLSILGACFFGYTLLGERQRPNRSKPPKSDVTIVTVEPLRLHNGAVPIEANGIVVPLREIRLATEVAGRVIEQSENLRAGKSVEQGELLIRLDARQYELEAERLQAQAAQESAELDAADVSIKNSDLMLEFAQQQLTLSQDERSRIKSLIRRNAASASENDAAKRSELTANASLVDLQNRRRDLVAQRGLIVQKKALTLVQLQRARLDIERCTILSPIDGLIVSSAVELDSFLPAGTSFTTIEDTSAVEVRCNLTAEQMVWVWNSRESSTQSKSVESDRRSTVPPVTANINCQFGTQNHCWEATLERIDGAGIDPQTRTYPCLFRVNAPILTPPDASARTLRRGMFVDLTIETMPREALFEVAENAIRPGGRIWIDQKGQLRILSATTVGKTDGWVIVDLPTVIGDETGINSIGVITSPMSDPVEGMRVGVNSPKQGRSPPDDKTKPEVSPQLRAEPDTAVPDTAVPGNPAETAQ